MKNTIMHCLFFQDIASILKIDWCGWSARSYEQRMVLDMNHSVKTSSAKVWNKHAYIQSPIHVNSRNFPNCSSSFIWPSKSWLSNRWHHVNLLSYFKRRHLLHICHRARKRLASEAEGNSHITILLQAMNYPNAVPCNVLPPIFWRWYWSFYSNPIPNLLLESILRHMLGRKSTNIHHGYLRSYI